MTSMRQEHQRKQTHLHINEGLSGKVLEINDHESIVQLVTSAEMVVDETGLIHGGFIFSLADHAAMACINHPNVVLGSATVLFMKPVRLGDILIATGRMMKIEGKKHLVEVKVVRDDVQVFSGDFTCFIPERHVLSGGHKP